MKLAPFLCAIAIAAAACSLNPQPFPPAPQDNGEDRGGFLHDDASADAALGSDSGTVPMDAGSDAFEADASTDAPSDAALDADPDALLDAPSDVALSSD